MKKQFKNNKKKGFTLIELIVVIVILGILAAVAVPRFTGMRHEALVKAEGSTAASIISAARVQEAETGVAVGGATATTVTSAVPATTDTAGHGKIDPKNMVIPTAPVYSIAKNSDRYVVTWTTAAGGDYNGKTQTLTEGTSFTPTK